MRPAGFSLLAAGWLLVLVTLVLLAGGSARTTFLYAGLGVQVLGLVLLFRSHLIAAEDKH